MRKISAGNPYPLGSTCDGNGVNFALFSANAEKVELCLFDENGTKELERYELTARENNIWHICIWREHAYESLFAVITLRLSLQFRHKIILTCLQKLINIFHIFV